MAEKKHYEQRLEENKWNLKGFWRVLKDIIHKKKSVSSCSRFLINNKTTSDKQAVANGFNSFFSCDQAALWMVQSVRPSVCLSVRPSVRLSVTPFWLCSHHPIIMKFIITSDKSDVYAKGQGQRSKVKVTEVTTQLNRFWTVTPVWIHIWWWDDAYSLIMLRRGALLFFKVILQISRSHGSKNRRIWPRLGVAGL